MAIVNMTIQMGVTNPQVVGSITLDDRIEHLMKKGATFRLCPVLLEDSKGDRSVIEITMLPIEAHPMEV